MKNISSNFFLLFQDFYLKNLNRKYKISEIIFIKLNFEL